MEVWEDAVYIRAAKLSLMLLTLINIFENTGLSRSVPSLHRAWFSNVMGKPTNLFFMSVTKKLQVKTELSTLDLGDLYISLEDLPSENSVYFNFTIDQKSNGFFILREDWVKIVRLIENQTNDK